MLVRQAVINYATEYGRYGYRAVTDLMRQDGWGINHKRVERIWKQEGLKVPQKHRPRKRLYGETKEGAKWVAKLSLRNRLFLSFAK